MKKLRLPEFLFAASCVMAVFGYGVVVGQREIFPYSVLQFGWESVARVNRERDTILGLRPSEFLVPRRYTGDGVTLFERDRAVEGLTLLSGLFDNSNRIRLIRLDGSIVKDWPVQYFDLFHSSTHIQPDTEVPKTNWNAMVHGAALSPDGSIVFNFDFKGAVKLDRCGKVQWTLAEMTHHSVSRASDGSFWIPTARHVTSGSAYPHLSLPYQEDSLLRVSADGEVRARISILEVLFKNNLQGMLTWGGGRGDVTHVNDVEELGPDQAARFPMFAAGDLLVSLRTPNLVLVVDPHTLVVKWFQAGPWLGQHDPDFLNNGRILVFNNNSTGSKASGDRYGGSNILEVDPATHATTYRFGVAPSQHVFTRIMGKHQELESGHLLITESDGGRAFEVEPDGRIVWEFVNRYDDAHNALITEATRYPHDYFRVSDWTCH